MDVIYNSLGDILVALVVMLVIPAALKYLNIQVDDSRRKYLEAAISGAIKSGINTLALNNNVTPKVVLNEMVNNPNARNNLVNFAEGYLRENVPTALQKLGVEGQIGDIVAGRLDTVIGELASKIKIAEEVTADVPNVPLSQQ